MRRHGRQTLRKLLGAFRTPLRFGGANSHLHESFSLGPTMGAQTRGLRLDLTQTVALNDPLSIRPRLLLRSLTFSGRQLG